MSDVRRFPKNPKRTNGPISMRKAKIPKYTILVWAVVFSLMIYYVRTKGPLFDLDKKSPKYTVDGVNH